MNDVEAKQILIKIKEHCISTPRCIDCCFFDCTGSLGYSCNVSKDKEPLKWEMSDFKNIL